MEITVELSNRLAVIEKSIKDLSESVVTVADMVYLSKAWSEESRAASIEAKRAAASSRQSAGASGKPAEAKPRAPRAITVDRRIGGPDLKLYVPEVEYHTRLRGMNAENATKWKGLNKNIGALEVKLVGIRSVIDEASAKNRGKSEAFYDAVATFRDAQVKFRGLLE